MKTRTNDYREVASLPKGALTVSVYASSKGWDKSYIYKQWRQHINDGKEIDFEIIVYSNTNFVIPA